jgi:hypothetical protein
MESPMTKKDSESRFLFVLERSGPSDGCFFCDEYNNHEVFLVQAPEGLLVNTHPACAAKVWGCLIHWGTSVATERPAYEMLSDRHDDPFRRSGGPDVGEPD